MREYGSQGLAPDLEGWWSRDTLLLEDPTSPGVRGGKFTLLITRGPGDLESDDFKHNRWLREVKYDGTYEEGYGGSKINLLADRVWTIERENEFDVQPAEGKPCEAYFVAVDGIDGSPCFYRRVPPRRGARLGLKIGPTGRYFLAGEHIEGVQLTPQKHDTGPHHGDLHHVEAITTKLLLKSY
jgi:hypothetical protein